MIGGRSLMSLFFSPVKIQIEWRCLWAWFMDNAYPSRNILCKRHIFVERIAERGSPFWCFPVSFPCTIRPCVPVRPIASNDEKFACSSVDTPEPSPMTHGYRYLQCCLFYHGNATGPDDRTTVEIITSISMGESFWCPMLSGRVGKILKRRD